VQSSCNPDTFGFLIKIGFLAVEKQNLESAINIFEVAYAVCPEQLDAKMGKALLLVLTAQHESAIRFLQDQILQYQPNFLPALGLCGMAMHAVDWPGWQPVLQRVQAETTNHDLSHAIQALLPDKQHGRPQEIEENTLGELIYPRRC
jgi:hypothetical protein